MGNYFVQEFSKLFCGVAIFDDDDDDDGVGEWWSSSSFGQSSKIRSDTQSIEHNLIYYCTAVHIKYGPPHTNIKAYQIPWITFIKSQSSENDYEKPTSR